MFQLDQVCHVSHVGSFLQRPEQRMQERNSGDLNRPEIRERREVRLLPRELTGVGERQVRLLVLPSRFLFYDISSSSFLP